MKDGLIPYVLPTGRIYCLDLPDLPTKREREIAGEKSLLTAVFGAQAVLQHHANGQPYVEEGEAQMPFISISHTKTRVCLAVSNQPCGVDMEDQQARIERLQAKFLCPSERQGLKPDIAHFTLCWCAKEAIYKLVGDRAGAFGEHIVLDTPAVGGLAPFTGRVGEEIYLVQPVTIEPTVLVFAQKI